MARINALLDSNVLIAMLVEDHAHHAPSLGLLEIDGPPRFAVAAHSWAETYSTLTRKGGPMPFGFTAEEAWAAIAGVRAMTELAGLTPQQTIETIRSYARDSGIGPRLYDRLIGEAAVAQGCDVIVTWNVTHMRGLFPNLRVETPGEFAIRSA
ncbi:PIN domain-containing protein [Sphingomonas sp. YR710]|jgi:predicted nucleic acid-binding protein|uniref:type II toxin-antitoxin system VapC family toxin n=1 Tax=Sphingomonas sp. YR710 TaxID=1882773 RepID=UPI000ADEB29A|nr:PIN domain-containing protein [Sphingomonas sp. YR710]